MIQYASGKSLAVGKVDGTLDDLKRKRDEQAALDKANGAPKKKVKVAAADSAAPTAPVAGASREGATLPCRAPVSAAPSPWFQALRILPDECS